MITVYDFLYVFIEDYFKVAIYDINTESFVFEGTAYEAMKSDYADCEIGSVDVPNGSAIFINVDLGVE